MAKLDTAQRKRLPKSEFGEPGKRAYPMEDKSHARNAKARASEMANKRRISEATKAKIDAKADRVLGEKGSKAMESKAKARKDERRGEEHAVERRVEKKAIEKHGDVHYHVHHEAHKHDHHHGMEGPKRKDMKAEMKKVRDV